MFLLSIVVLLLGTCYSMPTCQDVHQPFPGDETKFQMLSQGQWTNHSCPDPLIWYQSRCWCGRRPGGPPAPGAPIVVATTPAPANTVKACPDLRPHVGNIRKFEKLDRGKWVPLDCPGNLIWYQSRCWCDYPPPGSSPLGTPSAPANTVKACPDLRPHVGDITKFEKLDRGKWVPLDCPGNLIWYQSRCWCDYPPPGSSPLGTPSAPDNNGTACPGLRPHVGDIRKFEKLDRGKWVPLNCPGNLIWYQSRCWCDYPPPDSSTTGTPSAPANRPTVKACPDLRPHVGDITKFEKLDRGKWVTQNCIGNLIWYQSRCWCDYPPPDSSPSATPSGGNCNPIFNATFDDAAPKDHGQYSFHIGRTPFSSVTMENPVNGANGGAARVINGTLQLWFTGGNNFGSKVQIQFRFKVMESPDAANTDMTLFSNALCSRGPKTIEITYRPDNQRYAVFFRDTVMRNTISCEMNLPDPYAFHMVDLVFFDQMLSLHVDGVECFSTDQFKGGLLRTSCFMGLGGSNFDGYFDEATFRRNCRI